MYCPKCGDEKREEFTVCPVCHVPLVEELPPEPEPEYVELVTVLTSGNQISLGIAKSLLTDAGITYYTKNEVIGGFSTLGNISIGFNPAIGPVELQVAIDDEQEARVLLRGLDENENDFSLAGYENELTVLIQSMSDSELYEIVEGKRDEFLPEAIAAADKETENRGGLSALKQRLGIQ